VEKVCQKPDSQSETSDERSGGQSAGYHNAEPHRNATVVVEQ